LSKYSSIRITSVYSASLVLFLSNKRGTMQEFKGKVAVITGGAGGIGFGLAKHCTDEGMKVVLADIEGPALKAAEDTLRKANADVLAVTADVTKMSDIENLAAKTLDTFGAVHILFNNAGVQTGKGKMFWEHTLADWQWVLGVNLWGVIHGVSVFLPIMLKQNEPGHIVNTASVAGLISSGAIITYSVSKAAVIMLSENLYLQLKASNSPVGITVACPSAVRSRLNDAERNRPSGLANPTESPLTPKQQEIARIFELLNEQGMAPEEFAGLVFDAIRKDQLYLLSHPSVNNMIRQRMENILQEKNPEP
jgi:NAD(P)-dependent dehydrogenase (short-subunit alcohol dehydrogenase family)